MAQGGVRLRVLMSAQGSIPILTTMHKIDCQMLPGVGAMVWVWIWIDAVEEKRRNDSGESLPQAVNVPALIDTGCHGSVVDIRIATELGLRKGNPTAFTTLTQMPKEVQTHHFAVVFDTTPRTGFDVSDGAAIDLIAHQQTKPPMGLTLGRDILDRCKLTYDGRGGKVFLELG